jgi:hypothetical protein
VPGFYPPARIRSFIEQELPGSTNPCVPFVWLPSLRAETRFRFLFVTVTEGTFTDDTAAFTADLKDDLGYTYQLSLAEFMARAQLGRIAGRVHYDAWTTAFRGDLSHLHWPEVRLGLDIEAVSRCAVTVGAGLDFNPQRPIFTVGTPAYASQKFELPRPLTAGLYAGYSPRGLWGISPSLNLRCRFPVSGDMRVTEYEISAGIQTPETVTGIWRISGGWRYDMIHYESEGRSLDVNWSALFAELTYLY